MSFISKVILITGASSGIGKSIGDYLTERGHRVYGFARTVRNKEVNFPLIKMDVTNSLSVNRAINIVCKRETKIDVLINNAGVGITGPIEETSIEKIESVFQTNFFGVIRVTQTVLPLLRKNQKGMVINIASIAGFMGLPFRGGYSASKSALIIFSEALKMELKALNIKVTTVSPGDFKTEIATRRYHSPIIVQSPYEKAYERILHKINREIYAAKEPLDVAKKINMLIDKTYLKPHYIVGNTLQTLSVYLKRILPSTFFEKILTNHYKL